MGIVNIPCILSVLVLPPTSYFLIWRINYQKTVKDQSALVSICIPAYKRVHYLSRLLQSLNTQSVKSFEVVITDDSGASTEVEDYISRIKFDFPIRYFKNPIPLGSPKNWLACIDKAEGEWIKIMHDDDYFAAPDSLQRFVNAIYPHLDCIFSGYRAVYDDGRDIDMTISEKRFKKFLSSPLGLFSGNVIGPPSVMMFRKRITEQFDTRLKWIVDWEYYIRLALQYQLFYIAKPLICVSYNESQITNSCFLNPSVEIPETLIFTNKYSYELFDHFWAYDAWWRLLRNLKIRQVTQFENYASSHQVNNRIRAMILFQRRIPFFLLNVGVFSKFFMSISYLFSKFK